MPIAIDEATQRCTLIADDLNIEGEAGEVTIVTDESLRMSVATLAGQCVPITSSQSNSYGDYSSQTQYRNVTQGFYVTASVTGETVHLSISTNRDRLSQERPDVVNVQSTDTTVSGRVGEWITLAGINHQTLADKQRMTRSYATQGREDMTLRVKVETLDSLTEN